MNIKETKKEGGSMQTHKTIKMFGLVIEGLEDVVIEAKNVKYFETPRPKEAVYHCLGEEGVVVKEITPYIRMIVGKNEGKKLQNIIDSSVSEIYYTFDTDHGEDKDSLYPAWCDAPGYIYPKKSNAYQKAYISDFLTSEEKSQGAVKGDLILSIGVPS